MALIGVIITDILILKFFFFFTYVIEDKWGIVYDSAVLVMVCISIDLMINRLINDNNNNNINNN